MLTSQQSRSGELCHQGMVVSVCPAGHGSTSHLPTLLPQGHAATRWTFRLFGPAGALALSVLLYCKSGRSRPRGGSWCRSTAHSGSEPPHALREVLRGLESLWPGVWLSTVLPWSPSTCRQLGICYLAVSGGCFQGRRSQSSSASALGSLLPTHRHLLPLPERGSTPLPSPPTGSLRQALPCSS